MNDAAQNYREVLAEVKKKYKEREFCIFDGNGKPIAHFDRKAKPHTNKSRKLKLSDQNKIPLELFGGSKLLKNVMKTPVEGRAHIIAILMWSLPTASFTHQEVELMAKGGDEVCKTYLELKALKESIHLELMNNEYLCENFEKIGLNPMDFVLKRDLVSKHSYNSRIETRNVTDYYKWVRPETPKYNLDLYDNN